jgi:hypothetical protein
MLTEGQQVKVIADYEDPNSGWVGATGTFIAYRDGFAIVRITEGNPNSDDGNKAWFTDDELEVTN